MVTFDILNYYSMCRVDLLTCNVLTPDWDYGHVMELLGLMTPSRARVDVLSPIYCNKDNNDADDDGDESGEDGDGDESGEDGDGDSDSGANSDGDEVGGIVSRLLDDLHSVNAVGDRHRRRHVNCGFCFPCLL